MTPSMRKHTNRLSACLITAALFAVSGRVLAEEAAPEAVKTPAVADPMSLGNLTEVTLGLLAVLVVIFLVAWLVKRFGSFNTTVGGNLRVVGGVSVGQRERVLLVQVGDKQMLIGVAPGRVSMLHVLDEPIALEERTSGQDNFSQRLQAALNQRMKK